MADSNAATPWGPGNGTQVGMGGWGPQGEILGGGCVWTVWGSNGGCRSMKEARGLEGTWGGSTVGIEEMRVSGRGMGSYGGVWRSPRGPKLVEGM